MMRDGIIAAVGGASVRPVCGPWGASSHSRSMGTVGPIMAIRGRKADGMAHAVRVVGWRPIIRPGSCKNPSTFGKVRGRLLRTSYVQNNLESTNTLKILVSPTGFEPVLPP